MPADSERVIDNDASEVRLKRIKALWHELQRTKNATLKYQVLARQIREEAEAFRREVDARRDRTRFGSPRETMPVMPTEGACKPCPAKSCDGTLTFRNKTPVPGTGGYETTSGAKVDPETRPGWSCSICGHVEWWST
jgi:hypothetical protein